ncbi:hypothetical protein [Aequorivita antarctica]|uniref:hypothetical protein n=1 Tax=Aequorivita antarctica TaxID=153266 RepID=UPI001F1BA6E3|nr:hypothetical protein [Aequorivita antarctica]
MEGLEPIVINGELVAYEVQPGQGPSQVAADINNKKTQKKYGYSNEKAVTWSQVVAWNFDEFKAKGNWLDPSGIFDKNDETFKHLNINEHDVLFINQFANENFIYENEIPINGNDIVKGELVEPFNEPFTAGFSGGDAEAGVGYSGFTASTSIFEVPKESIFWEGGSVVRMTTLGAQISTPGLSTSLGAGNINFSGTKEPSIKRILNSPSHTETIGGISPIGVGVKYSQTISENYRASLTSIVGGTPGPIVSYGNSAWNHTDITVEGLKTANDSIKRAKEILKHFPGAKHAVEYLESKQGKARPLRTNEL